MMGVGNRNRGATAGPVGVTVPFPFTGTFQGAIISPPPNFTIFFRATLKDGNEYEYGYACDTEDETDDKLNHLNVAGGVLDNGPVPIGGRYFNSDKLGGAYYKILF